MKSTDLEPNSSIFYSSHPSRRTLSVFPWREANEESASNDRRYYKTRIETDKKKVEPVQFHGSCRVMRTSRYLDCVKIK